MKKALLPLAALTLFVPATARAHCHFANRGGCFDLVAAFEASWNLAAAADGRTSMDVRPVSLRPQDEPAPVKKAGPADKEDPEGLRPPRPSSKLWELFHLKGRLVEPITGRSALNQRQIKELFAGPLKGTKYSLNKDSVEFDESENSALVVARWRGTVVRGGTRYEHRVHAMLLRMTEKGPWRLDTVYMAPLKKPAAQ